MQEDDKEKTRTAEYEVGRIEFTKTPKSFFEIEAQKLQKSAAEIDKKTDEIEKRLDEINKRIDAINAAIEELTRRVFAGKA